MLPGGVRRCLREPQWLSIRGFRTLLLRAKVISHERQVLALDQPSATPVEHHLVDDVAQVRQPRKSYSDWFRGTLMQSLGVLGPLEGEHGDAGAVDALYLHGGAVGLDGVTGLRRASQGAEDIAAYGVEVLVGQVQLEALVHVGYRDAAVNCVEVVTDLLDGRLALVELVLDLTDYLLDDVLYGDKPLDTPPLVYYDGHLQRTDLELLEDLLDALVLGYDQALPDDRPYVEVLGALAGGPKQVLDVYCAEDLVQVFLVDGVARVASVDGGVDQLGERGVARQGLYVGPWDHDLACYPVAEVEDLVQVVALLGLEHARSGRGGDHDP